MAKEAQTEAEAMATITDAGYTNVTNMVQHGHTWHADAVDQNGNAVSVVVDGGSGAVHPKGEGDEPVVEHH